MQEVWRAVQGVPDLYVSSLGRVHSRPHDPRSAPHFGHPCPQSGRLRVVIKRGGRTLNFRIHKLVAEAFLGPRPPGLVIIHKDEDQTNNRASNLKYGTQRENLNMPKFLEYCRSRTGENHPRRKAKRR
jgi:hypothetical protein